MSAPMSNMSIRPSFRVLAAFLMGSVCVLTVSAAQAEEAVQFKFDPSLAMQFRGLENNDLGTGSDNQLHSWSLMPRARLTADFSDDIQAVIDARYVTTDGSTPGEDDTGESLSTNDYGELRQYYIKVDNFADQPGLSLQVGRQRIREEVALWWNRDIEAVRLSFNETLVKGFVAVGQQMTSNKTIDDFHEASQDRLRFMAEGSWQYDAGQYFDLRALYEDDHSDTGAVGDVILADDRDDEDFQLLWGGARLHGNFEQDAQVLNNIAYRLDGLFVTGSEDLVTSAAAGTDTRSITAINDRDVFGWAIDASAEFTLGMTGSPILTLGYAYGSGDDDATDGTDNAFRQSDLHGNSSLAGASSGAVYHYGEVLRPELSNIHILTLGLGAPLGEASDLSIFYHYYRLDEDATSLRQSSVRAALNGTDKDIGQEIDVVYNLDVTKAFDLDANGPFEKVKLRASAGVFNAGEAYGATEDENSARVFTELVFTF
ncbi:MAG: hypothetical protein EBQ96_00175 [Proteobacteria bacterium]|nr:hypothetical protein [Pseudomonadota bacterium]